MAKFIYELSLIPEWLGWCAVAVLATISVVLITHTISTIIKARRG